MEAIANLMKAFDKTETVDLKWCDRHRDRKTQTQTDSRIELRYAHIAQLISKNQSKLRN